VSSEAGGSNAKRREEIDWMLDAIAGAIVAGKLPPDDACAWAKIAAYEVEMLGLNTEFVGGTAELSSQPPR